LSNWSTKLGWTLAAGVFLAMMSARRALAPWPASVAVPL